MMSMIEQVARALDPTAWETFEHPQDVCIARVGKRASLRNARLAIAAMREPTLDMAYWGFDRMKALVCVDDEGDVQGRDASRVWQAMIDAALAEPGGGR